MERPATEAAAHYPNAPIVEALIEIFISTLPHDRLPLLEERLSEQFEYPQKQGRGQLTAQVTADGSQLSASATHRGDGFLFKSGDDRQQFQAHLNGFAFHRFKPYESWQPFREEAARLWNLFESAVGEIKIQAFGVRYINQLHLSAGTNLSEHLRVFPETDAISSSVGQYTMQATIPLDDLKNGILRLNQLMMPAQKGGAALILDLQVIAQFEDGRDLWDQIDDLRPIKDRIFEACITDRTRQEIS